MCAGEERAEKGCEQESYVYRRGTCKAHMFIFTYTEYVCGTCTFTHSTQYTVYVNVNMY
jgi:hypothetical protein